MHEASNAERNVVRRHSPTTPSSVHRQFEERAHPSFCEVQKTKAASVRRKTGEDEDED